MLATFIQENGLRGTYILKSDSPMGPFVPHSNGTICYAQLNDELTERVTEPVTIFAASSCPWVDRHEKSGHFVTE